VISPIYVIMNVGMKFREWLFLCEALDPATRASLEKADTRRFPDREFLKRAIEDMDAEREVIPAPDAWRRLNALAASQGMVVGKEEAALKKLSELMPRGTQEVDRFVQMWRSGGITAAELYSLGFFAARGARRNELDALARDIAALPANWRKRINFSDRPEISTDNGLSKFEDISDFSSALHSLAVAPLAADKNLEFDPKTDIRPERRKDLVIEGGGIWVYKGPDPTMCRLYGKGGKSKDSPNESPWCVAQTSNSHYYFQYRIDRGQTFYFIFDTNKDANDPARRVLAGVSDEPEDEEWSDMDNNQKINGHGGVEQYKRYLAGKLGVGVHELGNKMAPVPATKAEEMLKWYLDAYTDAA